MTEVYQGPPRSRENEATVVDAYHTYPTSQKEGRVEYENSVKTEQPVAQGTKES